MAITDLLCSDAPEWLAYQAVTSKILFTDPDLKRVGVNFQFWEGSPLDQSPPTESELPLIIVWPKAGGSDWNTAGSHQQKLQITFQCVVAGTSYRNLLKLWHLVRSALYPPPTSARYQYVYTILNPLVIGNHLSDAALDAASPDSGVKMLTANGTLNLTIQVNT